MKLDKSLEPFRATIEALHRLLRKYNNRGVIIGGIAVAHRAKDFEDIRTLADKHPKLDHHRIEYWVKAFSGALEIPDLWEEVEQILNR